MPTLSSVDPVVFSGTLPQVTVSDAGSDGWYGAGATFSLSGLAEGTEAEFRLDGGAWSAYTAPVALPAGTYAIEHRVRDELGRWSPTQTRTVKVDAVLPTVTASVSDRVVTLAADDADSGVAVVDYRLDGGQWLAYTTPVALDGSAHVVDFRATDVAGNASAEGRLEVATAPTTPPVAPPTNPPTPGPTAPTATGSPVVAGTPAVGRTLTATSGSWDQSGLSFAHLWLRDGVPVPGATGASFVLGRDDVGHRIAVQVTASNAGAAPGVARSADTGPVAKARSKVRLRVADRTPSAGDRAKVTVRVATTPVAVGATGKVVIRLDSKVVRRIRLDDGKSTLRLLFAAGKHTVKLSYAGSDSVATDAAKVKVWVRR